MPYLVETGSGARTSGLGSSLAGAKWRFVDGTPEDWQVSTYPQMQFNLPDAAGPGRGLTNGGHSLLLPLEFQRSGPLGDLNLEMGRWLRPAGQSNGWIAGALLGRDVAENVEVMAELHIETAARWGARETVANVGLRISPSDHYTLLASAGRDLSNTLGARQTGIAYLGLQLHL